jgi:hypothetical protein
MFFAHRQKFTVCKPQIAGELVEGFDIFFGGFGDLPVFHRHGVELGHFFYLSESCLLLSFLPFVPVSSNTNFE